MNNTCQKYRLIEKQTIDEFRGEGALYEHIQTGAKVFVLKNDDKNKVFCIGFRTTPKDSTGVAHIMEHSVLCGSAKYPLKDPFVELAKGSLNTFLNAMTFPDKTIYPIASTNDKDFMNLMDVYLDSVFHPNVYIEPKIFKQEGWHYELLNHGEENEELKINGVVYNEMKGAFSNPDSVLERYTMNSLFADTIYANESGGLPSAIPDLSYEEFLDFHRSYYHPSNSYIYLYGDMDMEEKLAWIDENYLCEYEKIDVDSHIDSQKPFPEPKYDRKMYAVGASEEIKGKCYLSENYVIDDAPTQVNAICWQILESVLLSSPGAVLREALVKAGIGEDIYGGLCSEIKQPYFSIIAKNTDEEKQEEFSGIIRKTLEELVKTGINKKSLKAELNYLEFKFREEDYGSLPAGLAACITMFSTWLYDDTPFTYLFYNDAIKEVKELIETDYFEQKIQKYFLDNEFKAYVNIVPEQGLTEKENAQLAEKLKAYKESLSEEEKEQIAVETLALKAYQAEPDEPDVLKKLPVLKVSDIDRTPPEPVVYQKIGNKIVTEANAKGIVYTKVMFDTEGLNEDELQFAALLSDILGEMDTKKHSYNDLYNEVLLNTGGVNFSIEAMPTREKDSREYGFKGFLSAEVRTLESKVADGYALAAEMICDTVFDDTERLMELLLEIKSHQQSKLESASHTAAVARASSYILTSSRYADLTGGVAYYDFVNAACKLTREPLHMKRFVKTLKAVHDKVFTSGKTTYAVYGSKAAIEAYDAVMESFEEKLKSAAIFTKDNTEEMPKSHSGRELAPLSTLNEGLKTSSQVNYVARVGDFSKAGLSYTGALKVLRVMLNYDYLWVKLRVLGGAYGCMSAFGRSGKGQMVSYRDPEISKTNQIFEELPDYLENWDGVQENVDKFIIGAISGMDRPSTASDKAILSIVQCFANETNEEQQTDRDEVLSCTVEDIRGLSAHIRAILKAGAICTIGNESQIENDKELFKALRDLY